MKRNPDRPVRDCLPVVFWAAYACIFFAASGCGSQPPEEGIPAMEPDTVSFLALGDSYTIGESVDSALRWPVQLAKKLQDEGFPTREPLIIARTGWTTDELAAGIQEAGIDGNYDLVTLLIGVNNQYRGRSPEEFRLQFLDLLTQALAFAGGDPRHVVVLSIPDWGVTPFAEGRDRAQIAREIDAFNAIKRDESEAAGVGYVDVTEISRGATTDTSLVAEDGLHPSGAMYALWAEATLPLAREALGAGGISP